MVWSPLAVPCSDETAKTRWRAVPFTAGKGLDLGCGKSKLFETEFCLGIDNGYDAERFGTVIQANIKMDAKDLSQLAGGGWDYVYSSFLLQYFPYKDVPNVLRDWMRLLKVNGNLILYLPDADAYPKCAEPGEGIGSESTAAEPGAHPEQKWNVTYQRLVQAMEKLAFNWDFIHYEQCTADDEYAHFAVFRRLK
jgi:SAM-dependent methyltransferase